MTGILINTIYPLCVPVELLYIHLSVVGGVVAIKRLLGLFPDNLYSVLCSEILLALLCEGVTTDIQLSQCREGLQLHGCCMIESIGGHL